jgi:glyoxylase-like metal-dependent hydrolase (beta-lactamase superfamily II)
MRTEKLDEHVYLIDVETGGLENFIASYVLKGAKAAIIETGPTSSIPNLLAGLKKINVRTEDVAYVAVTHIHLDHGGGVGTLLKSLPNAKVIAHPVAAPHLIDPEKLWQQSLLVQGKQIADMYHAPEPVYAEKILPVSDGMTFSLGNNVNLKVVETLGHASHHQSYFETLHGGLFLGDAAGIYIHALDVVVPTTPPPFRLDVALASLEKLVELNPTALYYSHFGKATDAVKRLRACEAQLRLWVSIAEEGLRNKQDFEDIRAGIIEKDDSVRKVLQFLRKHPVLSETVLNNSIQGAMKFVEKSISASQK